MTDKSPLCFAFFVPPRCTSDNSKFSAHISARSYRTFGRRASPRGVGGTSIHRATMGLLLDPSGRWHGGCWPLGCCGLCSLRVLDPLHHGHSHAKLLRGLEDALTRPQALPYLRLGLGIGRWAAYRLA